MPQPRRGRWAESLRARLLLLGLTTFLPLFGLAMYVAIEARERAVADAKVDVVHMARETEAALATAITGARQLVYAMVRDPALGGDNMAACAAALAAYLEQGRRYAAFVVAGRDGRLLCHSDPSAPPVQYADRDFFAPVLARRDTVVGNAVVGRVAQRPIIPVVRPILDEQGEVRRVLIAGLDLAWIGEMVSAEAPAHAPDIVMSDREGRTLFRFPGNGDGSARLAIDGLITAGTRTQQAGRAFEVEAQHGRTQIVAFESSREHPAGALTVRVGVWRDALTGAIDRQLAATLGTLVLVAAFALGATLALANRLVRRPVQRLASAAAGLGRGEPAALLREEDFSGEMRELASTFNRAAGDLAVTTGALVSSEARLRTIVENMVEGVVVSDLEGRLLHFNPAAFEMHGLRVPEEYVRAPPYMADTFELSGTDGVAWPVEQWPLARILRGETLHDVEARIRRKADGWERVFSFGGALARDEQGRPLMGVVTVRDVTEATCAQAEIRALNESLERRVQERTRQLADANAELESFAYSVSHDLRAPLRHIQGYADLLVAEAKEALPPEAQRHLQVITDVSVEMGRLIDDLLGFSRMGRVEMHVASVELAALVREVIRDQEMELKGRIVEWEIAPLPPVAGDAAMLKQVLANLLGNAVKYTRPRDPAHIEVGCAGERDGAFEFFVRDNGVGFDMRYAHKLFNVFQRLHRADEFEGTGIGLANVKRIISRHGGRVWAQAKENEGATFHFTLRPAMPEAEESIHESAEAHPAGG